ncbi:MAG: [protein-PII] uridylyltransferase [Alphaproteobacteria bacterium]|nr:[protein-PII] uridylyltransferase [Alphaproteobacteria bacterium]
MEQIINQREIFDRRGVQSALAAVAAAHPAGSPAQRALALEALKTALETGRAEIRQRFESGKANGAATVASLSFLVDQLVRTIHDFADQHVYPASNPTASERLAIVAVGGYGRGELAPNSDVDLLFLQPYKPTPRNEQVVEYILYALWDLKLKVGHSTRSIADCLRLAREDLTIRTALLESRFVWGDDKLYASLKKRFAEEVVAQTGREFVQAKLAERNERHKRMGDSRYVVEPNIKEGKGGLRDLHTLFWIAKYVHRVAKPEELVDRGVFTDKEAATFAKTQDFLWTLRCWLHYLTGRAEERLTFDVQAEIGRRMGYRDHRGTRGVERFMKHYFLTAKAVGDLTRIFCSALEIDVERKPRLSWRRLIDRPKSLEGFLVENDRLNVARNDAFAKDPVNFLRLFKVAQANDLEIHPDALRQIRQDLKRIDGRVRENREANAIFLDILTAREGAERTLRMMNEAGVFGRFVPDFGRVVAQTQHDMYHVYTVDEHTIFAIGIMHRIENGELKADHPRSSEVVHKVQSRRALYLAVLLHDIAKGRGGDHSELGAEIALKLGPRVGLSEEETETVAWLVRHHLAMSGTAFKRDIQDPKTIRDFCALVQSPERLRLLMCLTVADIRAVGPNVWNNWKATLIRDLYDRAEEEMAGVSAATSTKNRVEAAQQRLRAVLSDWADADFAEHVARGYPGYWLAVDTETQARHARLIREADRSKAPLSLDTRIDRSRGITEITIYCEDHPGLFSRIAGAMALAGATIVGAQIFTMSNGMALDTFTIQEAPAIEGNTPAPFAEPARLARLSTLIEQSLSGRIKMREQLAKRRPAQSRARLFNVPPRVFVDNGASSVHTVVEVNGRDRAGFLYDVTRAIFDLNLQISSAKIMTWGERVVDVFYVKDLFGHKIEGEAKIKRIRERLLAAISDPETPAEPARPSRAPAPAAATVAAQ